MSAPHYKPKFSSNVEVGDKGILTCKGESLISTESFSLLDPNFSKIAFSFIFLKINPNASIVFGVEFDDKSISYNYFDLLAIIRNDSVSPQIFFDGIGVLLNMYLQNKELHLYCQTQHILQNESVSSKMASFYIKITYPLEKVHSDEPCILASSFLDEGMQRFFPCYEPDYTSFSLENYFICRFSMYLSSSSSYPLFSKKPLTFLPGCDSVLYFEIIFRNVYDDPPISVGFTNSLLLNLDSSTIEDYTLFYYTSVTNNVYSKKNTKKTDFKIKSGTVIGFGLKNNSFFYTYNGIATYLDWNNDSDKKIYPFFYVSTGLDLTINFGQEPFSYKEITPPNGWSTWYPFHPNNFLIGNEPHPHLLNAFLFFGRLSKNVQPVMYKKELSSNDMYEIHFLNLECPNLMGCGIGPRDYRISSMVGWDSHCVGLHSDDGWLFHQSGSGTIKVTTPYFISTGTTETFEIKNDNISYYINKDKKENLVHRFTHQKYPIVTLKGSAQFILNFGESPFYAITEPSDDENSVLLFNNLKVMMENKSLEKSGLRVNDIIESRDRSLRGTVAGELNGRVFIYIETFPGAFPLVETDPYEILLQYKVVYRTNSLWQKVLVNSYTQPIIDASIYNMNHLYLTPNGPSFLIGKDDNNFYFRNVLDLFNNDQIFSLQYLPQDLMRDLGAKIDPFQKTDKLCMLDIVLVDDKALMAIGKVEGFLENNIACWDGTTIILISKWDSILLNPLGFNLLKSKLYSKIKYMTGIQAGGRYYPYGFTGFHGTCFDIGKYNKTASLSNFGCKAPPLLHAFLRSFLELSSAKDAINIDNDSQNFEKQEVFQSDFSYQSSTIETPIINNPLITEVEYSGIFIPPRKFNKNT